MKSSGPPRWKKGDFTETTVSSDSVFRGKLLHLKRDQVRLPDGKLTEREYVEHPGAVVVIALAPSGELVMERQFRYPLSRDFIELPAGKMDAGEDPLECAKRELSEETGYLAASWLRLGVVHTSIGYSNERIEIYLARDLNRAAPNHDDEEFIEVFTLPLSLALEWVRKGEITDSKTIVGLLWAEKVLGGGW